MEVSLLPVHPLFAIFSPYRASTSSLDLLRNVLEVNSASSQLLQSLHFCEHMYIRIRIYVPHILRERVTNKEIIVTISPSQQEVVSMSRIALGFMRIENLNKEQIIEILEYALAHNVNKIDLADIYGHTKCESLLGEVFLERPDLRKKFYLQSKVGIAYESKGYDSSRDYIISHVQNSIERLHCGYLDSLLIHRPDIFMDNAEIAFAVEFLQRKGLIRDFGVSNFNRSEIEYLKKRMGTPIRFDQVQLGIGNTEMIDPVFLANVPSSKTTEDLFFYLKSEGITIQCWSPYQMGFFEGSIFDEAKHPELNNVLSRYAEKYHTSKCAIATAFLLKLDPHLWVITGSTSISHIQEAIDGESIELSKEDWYALYQETGHFLP